jgi:TatA/E family protein of Tat protein translocase
MGPLGYQEMIFIFVLALLLFGPKKLPELGRTFGKALTEFRRASTELRATFDREMKNLEQETEPIKQAANEYHYDTYNYDYSSASHYDHSLGAGEFDSTASHPSLPSASAPQGAELTVSVAPEGTVPHGSETAAVSTHVESGPSTGHPDSAGTPAPATPATEHHA